MTKRDKSEKEKEEQMFITLLVNSSKNLLHITKFIIYLHHKNQTTTDLKARG